MNRPTLAAAAVLMLVSACSSGVGGLPPVASASDTTYRLDAGDEVRISVYGFDQMANTYVVADSGNISLPMLSLVPASGKTPAELEATIAGMLRERNLAPNANVSAQVTKYRPFYILGEVQKPGQYPYVPGMTLTTAVAIAGGYTFRANTKQAALTRRQGNAETHGQASRDTTVLPGDTIEVPEAWF